MCTVQFMTTQQAVWCHSMVWTVDTGVWWKNHTNKDNNEDREWNTLGDQTVDLHVVRKGIFQRSKMKPLSPVNLKKKKKRPAIRAGDQTGDLFTVRPQHRPLFSTWPINQPSFIITAWQRHKLRKHTWRFHHCWFRFNSSNVFIFRYRRCVTGFTPSLYRF